MPNYTDAVGYLLETRDEVNCPWFTCVCDLAISASSSALSNAELNQLISLLKNEITYQTTTAPTTTTTTTTPPLPAPRFLEELKDFNNFKRIANTLEAKFDKRVSVIFGANGTGKSSLCETLKILANPEPPVCPVHNVTTTSTAVTGFSYKFRDLPAQQWTRTSGFGAHNSSIKYFDSSIAVRFIQDPLNPERAVELTPFRLQIFEFARDFVTTLKTKLESLAAEETRIANEQIALIKPQFQNSPFAKVVLDLPALGTANFQKLKEAATLYANFTEETLLIEKSQELDRLVKAHSQDGLKILKAEIAELQEWLTSIKSFYDLCSLFSPTAVAGRIRELEEKASAQKVLAGKIAPEGVDINRFKDFLKASQSVINLSRNDHATCPYCRVALTPDAKTLLAQYHEFLTNTLEREIGILQKQIAEDKNSLKRLHGLNLDVLEKSTELISETIRSDAKACVVKIKSLVGKEVAGFLTADLSEYGAFSTLKPMVDFLEKEISKRKESIAIVESAKEVFDKKCGELTKEIDTLQFKKQFAEQIGAVSTLLQHLEGLKALHQHIDSANFTTLLRKVTLQAKKAHRKLVVTEFERKLDDEYFALSEKRLVDFSVTLNSRGEEAAVILDPAIAGNPIQRVLSEGEQKLHSIALFFTELNFEKQDVVVFDDPVSSFDYNNIARFCRRLRDFIAQNQNRQVIVFTHNWEFFIQLQEVLNKARLTPSMSVMVLENCSIIAEYKEKIDELKGKIIPILQMTGEPSSAEKETLAGNMRRLIEAIVNTHVFAGQRYQYKQRKQAVSEFQNYTGLIPLTTAEATTFRDLFSDLSISEHDDQRNAYINQPKAVFQARYDRILQTEAAIVARG